MSEFCIISLTFLPKFQVFFLENHGCVFSFLTFFIEFASDNKMTPANLGMVFGIVLIKPPGIFFFFFFSLFWRFVLFILCPDSNVSNVGSSMPKEICTFFVENVDDIFDNDDSTDE